MSYDDDHYYSTTEVVQMTGATYRQVDYYARTGRVPGQPPGHGTGSGHRRRWTDEQVARVALLLRASEMINATLDEAIERLADVG